MDLMSIGSTLSVRSYARVGEFVSIRQKNLYDNGRDSGFYPGQLSLSDFSAISSTLSLRSFVRGGSSTSVLQFVHIGSSMSLRAFVRTGGNLSTIDFAHMGSSCSIRSFARLGSCLSLQTGSPIRIGSGKILYDSSTVKFYATTGANPSITLTTSQGKLHGTWTYETSLTSDRRLKTDIRPLIKDISSGNSYSSKEQHANKL